MTTTASIDAPKADDLTRSKRLKAATHAAHGKLDTGIMSANSFHDRARYRRFLRVQYLFHPDIDALYLHPHGRAQHWREFTGALDAVGLDPQEEERVVSGTQATFARVQAWVDGSFA